MQKLSEILTETTTTSGASTAASSASASSPDAGELCRFCAGARFVRLKVGREHADFGKAVPCRCTTDDSAEGRSERLVRYSNIGALARLTFRNVIARGRSTTRREQDQYKRCVDDARSFADAPEGWLLLSGASGCGKTHIAAAVVNRLIERGEPVLFVVVPDLLDHLRSAYQPAAEIAYDDLFERVRSAPVLVLDDLGTQAQTPWAQEKLFQLINHRFNARLPTVVTTNLHPDQIDDRLRTRLTDAGIARVYALESRRPNELRVLDVLDHPLIRDMTFERFDTRGHHLSVDARKRTQDAHRQALSFAQAPEGWLLFMGEHGSGKTHLAAAIANYRRANNESPNFVVVADLLDYLRRGTSDDEKRTSHDAFDEMKLAPLLVLDDLEKQAGWVWDRLYQLLNYRFTARLATVITTALSNEDVGERLASRLIDPSVCTVMVLGEPQRSETPPRRMPRRRANRTS